MFEKTHLLFALCNLKKCQDPFSNCVMYFNHFHLSLKIFLDEIFFRDMAEDDFLYLRISCLKLIPYPHTQLYFPQCWNSYCIYTFLGTPISIFCSSIFFRQLLFDSMKYRQHRFTICLLWNYTWKIVGIFHWTNLV